MTNVVIVTGASGALGRAVVMPNLKPPVTRVEDAQAYYQRICAHRPAASSFEPLMTLYLTGTTTASARHLHGAQSAPNGA